MLNEKYDVLSEHYCSDGIFWAHAISSVTMREDAEQIGQIGPKEQFVKKLAVKLIPVISKLNDIPSTVGRSKVIGGVVPGLV